MVSGSSGHVLPEKQGSTGRVHAQLKDEVKGILEKLRLQEILVLLGHASQKECQEDVGR